MAKNRGMDPKMEALRRQGSLNPHPEKVTDTLFQEVEFFDPRDLLQLKYEMLRRVLREGQPATHTPAAFGFSRTSFYQARRAFELGGLLALAPRRRGPRGAHKLTKEVMDFVEQTLGEDASLGGPALASLVERRFGVTVHPRSIERQLARRQKKGQ